MADKRVCGTHPGARHDIGGFLAVDLDIRPAPIGKAQLNHQRPFPIMGRRQPDVRNNRGHRRCALLHAAGRGGPVKITSVGVIAPTGRKAT